MTADVSDAPADLVEWVRGVTGAHAVRMERRSAGGSRAGYAVDVEASDGTQSELWLRSDTGAGPQSNGPYTLRREASVYRQVHEHGVKVAEVVAVHPTAEAFLMKRLPGRNWFSEVEDPDDQERIATQFMEQLATVHGIDVRGLDLPELGPVGTVAEHIRREIDIWEAQFRAHDEPEPVIELAIAWLRRALPPDDDWPLVLVHGDAGPGNFMFDGDHLVAITDWELAHFGDLHDDLAWIYVHDLQERFPDLRARLLDYSRASGFDVDATRLRYFLVLAQTRCAIGTRKGLLARDSRGEIASHLIYTTLHTRALAEALAMATDVPVERPEPIADPGASPRTWMYDIVLDDMRTRVVPAIEDGFAARRAKGVARLVKLLREEDRLGIVAERADCEDLRTLLDTPVDDVVVARRELCRRIRANEVETAEVVDYCVRDWARRTQLLRPAMGVLADRRFEHLP
jgi:aminoglycoside phosphotransferase (APT) family kinase protein